MNARRSTVAVVLAVGMVLAASSAMASIYSDTVLADNPLAYWRLGDAALPTAKDEIGAGNGNNPGTCVNSPSLGQAGGLVGDPDTAVRLSSGSAQYVNIPDAAVFDFSGGTHGQPFTLEAWVKKASNFSYSRLIDKTQAGVAQGYGLDMRDAGFRMLGTTNGSFSYNTAGNTTDWFHVVAVSNGAGTAEVFVNGQSIGTAGFSSLNPWTGPLRIGADSGGGSNLNATVDEAAVYGYALTPDQIAHHHSIGQGLALDSHAPNPNYPGLRLWLDASDTSTLTLSGTTVTHWADKSACGNVGSQADTARQPTLVQALTGLNGHDAVRLDGNDFLQGAITVGASKTFFIVAQDNGSTSSIAGAIYTKDAADATGHTSNGVMSDRGNDYWLDWPGGSSSNSADMPLLPGFSIVTGVYDGSNLSIYLDDALMDTYAGSGLAKGHAASLFQVGTRNNELGRYFTGDIAEVLIYDGALNQYDRALIAGYLHAKYAPEPATLTLLGLGALGLLRRRRKR